MANLPPASAGFTQPASPSWAQRVRRLVAPAVAPDAESAATGVVNVQVWMDQAIWRPAGLWAMAAGLLAAGGLRQMGDLDWQALALLAVLVDALWGSIWRLSGGRRALLALPSLPNQRQFSLPYMQAGSPAARLLAGDHTDIWPSALRIGAPAAVAALLVAALLGVYALTFTLAVIVLTALGWTLRRTFGYGTPLLQSCVAIGLPWLLTVQQVQAQGRDIAWMPQLLLPLFWVLHQWGAQRNGQQSDWFGLLGMAAAQVGICTILIAVQAPLWLGPLAVLLLPTWLLAYQQLPQRRLRVVMLAAMLVSAIALGQTVGI